MEETKYPKLTIHNLGPIKDCEMTVNDFTVFVGPQSQGKSTIAKAVYFFRSVKQDIMNLMLPKGPVVYNPPVAYNPPVPFNSGNQISWNNLVRQTLIAKSNKFFYPFFRDGTSLTYHYTEDIWIGLSVIRNGDSASYAPKLTFSDEFSNYLVHLDNNLTAYTPFGYRETQENKLDSVFNDYYAPVFIPAGRQLTTLLNSQMSYVFGSMSDVQKSYIDCLTYNYVMQILLLQPAFEHGWDGVAIPFKQIMQKDIRKSLERMKDISRQILGGEYRYSNGVERLLISDGASIDLNYASSGQQETVWPLNLMFYYLPQKKKTFLIFEEPESNLYPDAQRTIGELLALFRNAGNQVMVTTHSPYLLGTFNYLLMGGQCEAAGLADGIRETLETDYRLTPDFWLSPATTDAYFVNGGSMDDAKTDVDGVRMIKNELIDGVSEDINAVSDLLLGKLYGWDNGDA